MKLFVITSRFPYPLEKGDKLRLYHQLKVLSEHFDIYLAAISHETISKAHLSHINSIVKELRVFRMNKIQALLSVVSHSFIKGSLPAQCAYFYSPEIESRLHDWMVEINPDRIYYQLIRTLPYYRNASGTSVLDLMDAFSTGAFIRAKNTKGLQKKFWNSESERVRQYEQHAISLFSKLTIISDLDKERVGGSPSITVVNNGIDEHFFEPLHGVNADFDASFVGNLGYYPNVKAVEYISKNIVPLMRKKRPDFRVNIVGPNQQRVAQYASDGVHISGWYDNVKEGYQSGKIFLAPLFEGIGQQNKILEAMALGIPCVTTPDVAKALKLENGYHVRVGDNAQDLCNAILDLLFDEDYCRKLRTNASTFVQHNYKWSSVTKPLVELLKS